MTASRSPWRLRIQPADQQAKRAQELAERAIKATTEYPPKGKPPPTLHRRIYKS